MSSGSKKAKLSFSVVFKDSSGEAVFSLDDNLWAADVASKVHQFCQRYKMAPISPSITQPFNAAHILQGYMIEGSFDADKGVSVSELSESLDLLVRLDLKQNLDAPIKAESSHLSETGQFILALQR